MVLPIKGPVILDSAPGQVLLMVPPSILSSRSEIAAVERGLEMGLLRGSGFVLSPPVRGFFDPYLPLSTRLSGGFAPSTGSGLTLYRHSQTTLLRDLVPRFKTQGYDVFRAEKILTQDFSGLSDWEFDRLSKKPPISDAYQWYQKLGVTYEDLKNFPDLVRKANEHGVSQLTSRELSVLKTIALAHGNDGIVFGSPGISVSGQADPLQLPDRPLFRKAPYRLTLDVNPRHALDLNKLAGSQRSQHLIPEIEHLVVDDLKGNIVKIEPNPTSDLAKSSTKIRNFGRFMGAVGVVSSTVRIVNAEEDELVRVISEEVGSNSGGFVGAGLATWGCIALGVASGGWGLLACAALGGIAGGYAGSETGGALSEWAGY